MITGCTTIQYTYFLTGSVVYTGILVGTSCCSHVVLDLFPFHGTPLLTLGNMRVGTWAACPWQPGMIFLHVSLQSLANTSCRWKLMPSRSQSLRDCFILARSPMQLELRMWRPPSPRYVAHVDYPSYGSIGTIKSSSSQVRSVKQMIDSLRCILRRSRAYSTL